MRIAVLGAGAMGMLIGGMLSTANDVTLIDVNESLVEKIAGEGVVIHEADGSSKKVWPKAVTSVAGLDPVELMIVFVKAMYSDIALEANRSLIGKETCLMTLQNGSGHEETLMKYVDKEHIVIGTTQHNSSIAASGEVRHGGAGHTYIGCLSGDIKRFEPLADAFRKSGIETDTDNCVKKLIWKKMFTNVSASVLTGVLQCPLGYIAADPDAWKLCEQLIHEAVQVAKGEGLEFDEIEEKRIVYDVCTHTPNGVTSICADIASGRKSEVDTISGSIVRASVRCGIPAPTHEMIVHLVHAMERRIKEEKQ